MLQQILEFLLSPVSEKLEVFLAENAQKILKPYDIAQPNDGLYLATLQTENRTVTPIEITAEDQRVLYAHKVRINHHTQTIEADKKAIVYMPGNCPFVIDSLPNVEILLNDFPTDSDIVGVCQHYRGRGINQLNHEENFSHYTLLRDVKDQAALLQHLVEKEAYKPENILVLGYSYGSTVGIWTLYYLLSTIDKKYSNIKFFSDRGFGNLFNFRFIKPLLPNQEKAHQKLVEKEMMPDSPLDVIVKQHLPDSFIMSVAGDECIWTDYALASSLQEDEFAGRVFNSDTSYHFHPHYSGRSSLNLKMLNEIKPHHFMTAILYETSINVRLKIELPFLANPDFKGYALTYNTQVDSHDFIPLRIDLQKIRHRTRVQENQISIFSDVLSRLILALHHYAIARAAEAAKSEQGSIHKRGTFDYVSIGCTAKQQVAMAVCLMNALASPRGPDFATIKSLQQKNSITQNICGFFSHLSHVNPHHSGELGRLFSDICQFMDEYEKILKFNQWILSMSARREERIIKYTNEDNLADWFQVDNQPTLDAAEDLEWVTVEETPITDDMLRKEMRMGQH